MTFTSDSEMVVPFRMKYDTNQWYRRLRVSAWASKAELKRAYQNLRGWKSYRLTYILTQLLRKRKVYDSIPLGSFYMDEEVKGWLRRERSNAISELRKAGALFEAELLANEDMGDWEEVTLIQEVAPIEVEGYPYSYYLWDSECDDEGRLLRWQELLLSGLRKADIKTEIALGFVGDSPVEVRTVGYRLVIFLGDDQEPTESLAEIAIHRVAQEINKCQDQTSVKEQRPQRKPPKVEAILPGQSFSRSKMVSKPSSVF